MIDEENMSMPIMGEQQKKEIKTIKERKITDKDCTDWQENVGSMG